MSTAHRYLLLLLAAIAGCASGRDKAASAGRPEALDPASTRSAIAEGVKVAPRATGEALRARG